MPTVIMLNGSSRTLTWSLSSEMIWFANTPPNVSRMMCPAFGLMPSSLSNSMFANSLTSFCSEQRI